MLKCVACLIFGRAIICKSILIGVHPMYFVCSILQVYREETYCKLGIFLFFRNFSWSPKTTIKFRTQSIFKGVKSLYIAQRRVQKIFSKKNFTPSKILTAHFLKLHTAHYMVLQKLAAILASKKLLKREYSLENGKRQWKRTAGEWNKWDNPRALVTLAHQRHLDQKLLLY